MHRGRVESVEGVQHGFSEGRPVLFAAEVQTPHVSGVSPLVEVCRGLVVLHSFQNGAVYHHLLVGLQFTAHHPEGVCRGAVVDVHSAQGGRVGPRGNPAFTAVVVQHDGGPHLAHTGLTHICAKVQPLCACVSPFSCLLEFSLRP